MTDDNQVEPAETGSWKTEPWGWRRVHGESADVAGWMLFEDSDDPSRNRFRDYLLDTVIERWIASGFVQRPNRP